MSFGAESDNPFANPGMDSPFAGFQAQTPPDGCTQCGMCLPSCPTFIKSEDPEQSPMGRIRLMRALEEGVTEGLAVEKLESCLGCYSCQVVCPSRVDYGNMLDHSLARLREQRPVPAITGKMLFLAKKPTLLKPLMRVTHVAQTLGLRGLLGNLGLYKLTNMQRAESLLGRVDYPGELRNRSQRPHNDRRVALFTGCFSSVMEKEVQQTAIDVLNALGREVILPEGQGCCGALHRHNGDLETAEKMARKNIHAFTDNKAEAILTTSSGCGAGLKAYREWLDGEELPTPIIDVSHYLADSLRQRQVAFDRLPLKVAIHTPCTLRQGAGQEEAVMELLQKIPGLEIVPLSGMPRCCGAGGSQMLSQPEMADALRDDIVKEIEAMKPDMVISSNLGCAMHLKQGMTKAGINAPLKHPVQLVAQSMVKEFVSRPQTP